jgi:hypothetical protein
MLVNKLNVGNTVCCQTDNPVLLDTMYAFNIIISICNKLR